MSKQMTGLPPAQGLYDPRNEHDACGVGFVCHIKGQASHEIVSNALLMLEHMNHRGACGCEEDSGDGAGILIRIPDAFLRAKCRDLGITLPPSGNYAAGMIFLTQDAAARRKCEQVFERTVRQVFIGMGSTFYNRTEFERRLYIVRQRAENVIEFESPEISAAAREDFYICSLSANRMVYKGMLTATQLRQYYLDLQEPAFTSALAMVHSRFSTNTFPSWRL